MAKKMLDNEKKKEKTKAVRMKAKEKAAKKVAKQKETDEAWDSFMNDSMKTEIWAVIWIVAAVFLVTLFFSTTDFSVTLLALLAKLFGMGTWLIPLFLGGIGVAFLLQRDKTFPPARVLAILLFFVSLLGFLNLFVPLEDSLADSKSYGGALGFAIGFFPREFLGDTVAAVLLFGLFWVSGMVAFGIRISDVLQKFRPQKDLPISDNASSNKSNTKQKITPAAQHFKNELEIIDSTGDKPSSTNTVDLEEKEDELTKAKNQALSGTWEPPDIELLKEKISTIVVDEAKIRQKAEVIREKLEQFGIEVIMKSVHVGPTVTQFTLQPSAGIKLTKITALKNDLALALAAKNLRIEAPIQGRSLVGIEIPNDDRAIVGMREILESDVWADADSNLKLALGRDVAGKPFVADLQKMPHLLIAGKTGSGKSVAMNSFLISLLWQNSPDKLKLILVDPKRVELSLYNNLPYLLTPVIVEPEKCVSALAWAVAEMNRRYKLFEKAKCRNITEYNDKHKDEKEPFIVIVIDELADLMMVAGKDVEAAICRIAQMARAVGMHLIVATQRPSVDVVTGLIKANLPARIAFKVSSGIDSRTIIDQIGAEDLLGFGDMLNLDGNSGTLTRLQGIYISNEEVERVTNHIKLQFPEMIANDEITNQSIEGMAKGGVLTAGSEATSDENLDPLFQDAVFVVLETNKASASFLQRRLEIGYARAARILDQMEGRGIIGPSRGAKPREIYGLSD